MKANDMFFPMVKTSKEKGNLKKERNVCDTVAGQGCMQCILVRNDEWQYDSICLQEDSTGFLKCEDQCGLIRYININKE